MNNMNISQAYAAYNEAQYQPTFSISFRLLDFKRFLSTTLNSDM